MKKIILCLTILFATFGLTACGDSVASTKQLDELKGIISEQMGVVNPLDGLENPKEFLDENYEYYLDYITISTMINQFVDALGKSKLTSKQFELVVDAVDTFFPSDDTETASEEMFNPSLYLLDLVFGLNISSDQIINVFFYSVMDFDTTLLNAVDACEYKTDYESVHVQYVTMLKEGYEVEYTEYPGLNDMELLFDLTDDNRKDALIVGELTLGNVLNYAYNLESALDLVLNVNPETGLTESDFIAIVKANKTAFDKTFGKITESKVKNAMNAVNRIGESLYGDDFMPADEEIMTSVSKEVVSTIKTTKEALNILCKDANLKALYSVMMEDENFEESFFVTTAMFAELVVLFGEDVCGAELVAEANTILTFDFKNLTDAQKNACETFFDNVGAFIGALGESLNPEM